MFLSGKFGQTSKWSLIEGRLLQFLCPVGQNILREKRANGSFRLKWPKNSHFVFFWGQTSKKALQKANFGIPLIRVTDVIGEGGDLMYKHPPTTSSHIKYVYDCGNHNVSGETLRTTSDRKNTKLKYFKMKIFLKVKDIIQTLQCASLGARRVSSE